MQVLMYLWDTVNTERVNLKLQFPPFQISNISWLDFVALWNAGITAEKNSDLVDQ